MLSRGNDNTRAIARGRIDITRDCQWREMWASGNEKAKERMEKGERNERREESSILVRVAAEPVLRPVVFPDGANRWIRRRSDVSVRCEETNRISIRVIL